MNQLIVIINSLYESIHCNIPAQSLYDKLLGWWGHTPDNLTSSVSETSLLYGMGYCALRAGEVATVL
jgi:hypothetical protein